jgi:hypothetical protein
VFLGLQIDSTEQIVTIPQEKLVEMRENISTVLYYNFMFTLINLSIIYEIAEKDNVLVLSLKRNEPVSFKVCIEVIHFILHRETVGEGPKPSMKAVHSLGNGTALLLVPDPTESLRGRGQAGHDGVRPQ